MRTMLSIITAAALIAPALVVPTAPAYAGSDSREWRGKDGPLHITRGPRVISAAVKEEMRKILTEVQTGQFARDFILENQAGAPHLKSMRRIGKQHPIEVTGEKLRGMMSWIGKNRLVDQSKN